jgi:hypothetical protein
VAILTLTEFVSYVGSEIVANQADLTIDLAAAEYAVKHHCHRNFDIASATTARVFTPPPFSDALTVDDFSTTVGLVIADNGTAVPSTDYQLEPLNGLDDAGNTVPYTTIRRVAGNWYRYGDKATVSVTAKWGWTAVPSDVVEAVRVLGKDLAGLRDTRFGVAGWGDFGVVRMRDNPQVMSLLAPHVRADRVGV